MALEFDTTKFELGVLCKRDHDYQGSEQSLRYHKGKGGCVECVKLRYQERREIILKQKQEYYESHKEEKRIYNQQYAEENADRIRQQQAEYREANREEVNARSREWGKRNRDQKLAYMKARHERMKDVLNAQNRQYYHENRDRSNEYRRQHYKLHREEVLAKKRLDYQQNPEKYRERNKAKYKKHRLRYRQQYKDWAKTSRGKAIRRDHEHRRLAQKQNTSATKIKPEQIKARILAFQNRCAYCAIELAKVTIDHVIPLAKGGCHSIDNLVPACRSCNSSKSDRDAHTWYLRQDFYSKERWSKILSILAP